MFGRKLLEFFVGWRLVALQIALGAGLIGGGLLWYRHKIHLADELKYLQDHVKLEKILDKIHDAPADRSSMVERMHKHTY